MERVPLSVPEIAIISGTRAALGAGVGLLISDRLRSEQRRAVGWALVGIGIATTIPIVTQLIMARRDLRRGPPPLPNDDRPHSRGFRQPEYAP